MVGAEIGGAHMAYGSRRSRFADIELCLASLPMFAVLGLVVHRPDKGGD